MQSILKKEALLDQAIEEAYKEIVVEQIEDLVKEHNMIKSYQRAIN